MFSKTKLRSPAGYAARGDFFIANGPGLLTIYTVRSASIVALHTGFGALLLASLLSVYFLQLQSARTERVIWLLKPENLLFAKWFVASFAVLPAKRVKMPTF